MKQRWAESEKLILKPNPAPKTKNPDPVPKPVSFQIFDSDSALSPSLPCFNTHKTYIPYTPYHNTESGFFPKI